MINIKQIIKNKLWISSLAAIIFVLVLIPLYFALTGNPSNELPNGTYVTKGSRVFYSFLNKIKATDGILILGTSETGNDLFGHNYWNILNHDKNINKKFYVLHGAGRCAHTYFPLILDNPKCFKSLNILYYINPIYWSKSMNSFNQEYFKRYADSSLVFLIKDKAIALSIYNGFMKPINTKNLYYNISIDRIIDNYKSFFYYDLIHFLSKDTLRNIKKINTSEYYTQDIIQKFKNSFNGNKIDLKYNVTEDFLLKGLSFPEIDATLDFQYNVLANFIVLIKRYNIHCVFYLGPFNAIYCKEKSPELLDKYQDVILNIKKILISNNVPFIDGSNLSTVPGTFIDAMHNSEYGAYLKAIQIKEFYEKSK